MGRNGMAWTPAVADLSVRWVAYGVRTRNFRSHNPMLREQLTHSHVFYANAPQVTMSRRQPPVTQL